MSELKKVVLKVGDIVKPEFQESFKKLQKTPTMSGQISFRVAKLAKKIREACTTYTEARDEFLKHASIDEKTGEPTITGCTPTGDVIYGVQTKNVPEFNKKVKELGVVEIEVDEFKYADLGYTDATPNDDKKINSFDIANLGFIVE